MQKKKNYLLANVTEIFIHLLFRSLLEILGRSLHRYFPILPNQSRHLGLPRDLREEDAKKL